MPRLFVLSGNLVGRTYTVQGAATLGRGKACGLRLPDISVSREHARIEPDALGGWWIVDLGSRNGVKVNGERVESAALSDLDEVMLGELLLRFRTEEGEAPPASAPERPATPPAPPEEDDAGFELEEEIQLGETRSTPSPAVEWTERDRERARILAASSRSGLLSGDLQQRPWPLRWSAYLGAAAVMAGVFYGVYRLVLALRGM